MSGSRRLLNTDPDPQYGSCVHCIVFVGELVKDRKKVSLWHGRIKNSIHFFKLGNKLFVFSVAVLIQFRTRNTDPDPISRKQ